MNQVESETRFVNGQFLRQFFLASFFWRPIIDKKVASFVSQFLHQFFVLGHPPVVYLLN